MFRNNCAQSNLSKKPYFHNCGYHPQWHLPRGFTPCGDRCKGGFCFCLRKYHAQVCPDFAAYQTQLRRVRLEEEEEKKRRGRRWRRKKKLHKPRTSSICVSSRVCPAIFPLLSAYTLLCFISHAYHEIEIRVSSTLDLCSVSSLCGASWDPFSGITRLRAGSEHQSALVILSRQSLYSKT